MHAVQRLYLDRKKQATKPFNARGKKVIRCQTCKLGKDHCICTLRQAVTSETGFLILMYDTEVLKPSNTGKLIADLIPDTYAYLWSRTEIDPTLVSLIEDPKWQPFVIFPEDYVASEQQIVNSLPSIDANKRPLFILLDGSWREAKKMFRKSPYLAGLPVLSIDLTRISGLSASSQYQIRKAANDNQLATAEVAAQLLNLANEASNAERLLAWFNLYTYQYQKSVCRRNAGDPASMDKYLKLTGNE